VTDFAVRGKTAEIELGRRRPTVKIVLEFSTPYEAAIIYGDLSEALRRRGSAVVVRINVGPVIEEKQG